MCNNNVHEYDKSYSVASFCWISGSFRGPREELPAQAPQVPLVFDGPVRFVGVHLRWSRLAQQTNPYWWEDEQKSPNKKHPYKFAQICLVTPQFLWCDPGFSELVVLWERQICFKMQLKWLLSGRKFHFFTLKKLEDFFKLPWFQRPSRYIILRSFGPLVNFWV